MTESLPLAKPADSQDGQSPTSEPIFGALEVDSEEPNAAGSGLAREAQDDSALGEDEAARIVQLAATARDQDEIEKDIGRQADQMLLDQAEERDQKRIERTLLQKEKLVSQIRKLQQRLRDPAATAPSASARIRAEIQHMQPQVDALDQDLQQITERMEARRKDGAEAAAEGEQAGNSRRPGESKRDFLIRIGKITPFSKVGTVQLTSSNLADVMLDAEDADEIDDEEDDEADEATIGLSHQNLRMPGFADDESSLTDSTIELLQTRPLKRRKVLHSSPGGNHGNDISSDEPITISDGEFDPTGDDSAVEDGEISDEYADSLGSPTKSGQSKRKRKSAGRGTGIVEDDTPGETVVNLEGIDDGNEKVYLSRLDNWSRRRKAAREKALRKVGIGAHSDAVRTGADTDEPFEDRAEPKNDEDEWLMPHPTIPDTRFESDFRIPGDIFPSLFDYQKTGVQWLWELYLQQVGGIVGDEMGLGKTIQVIAFLAGLHHSNKLRKPIIIVTPATVMKQWVNEFHRWWPPLRVSILHTSGSGMMNVQSEREIEDRLETSTYTGSVKSSSGSRAARKVVNRVLKEGHILVTTYSGLQSYAELLLPIEWGYAVLDEGHKIRNPNAKITIYCKSLRTPNRVILSGTPMQNNLTELWSLFDFIFPLRLGNLVSFRTQFEIPIKQGGYANASNLQVETALQCAETLKDAISPYLLQRFKVDVAADLPKKSEQVLFCRLTKLQRDAYESFLASGEMTSILEGKRQALYGIDILRKICNHPDLQEHRKLSIKPGYNYGVGSKSGKMQVVKALLQLWRDTGHKTLLFAQHRIMLDILEKFLKGQSGFNYRRMDGTTPIKDRQDMVDEFNRDPRLHVFLLTTKVGGLGVNLTGADRVIIYDPDWNPSTDMQARERSWRLGQKREVMIYRLMTAGTIEEKIYHRQIFKQFLTNKILRDPKQRQTFQLKDLHDLFSLGNADAVATETVGLFKGTEVKFDKNTDEPAGQISPDSHKPTEELQDSSKIKSLVGVSHLEKFDAGEEVSPSKVAPIGASTGTSGEDVQAPIPTNNDARLLSSIFSRTGVHSALEHDAIISSSSRGKVTADPMIIAREAKRVATAAAKELQRASETARSVPAGTPTWTGMYGSGGRPEEQRFATRGRGATFGARGGRGGPSSAAVLAGLSARQTGQDGERAAEGQPSGEDFLKLIRDYLVAHGGSVYTQMLIDHFNRFCRTPERTAEFKEMLRAIAVLDKGATPSHGRGRGGSSRGGRAKWILKKEFGGSAE